MAFGIAERAATPVAGWFVVEGRWSQKLAATALLSVAVGARAIVSRAAGAYAEGELYRRTAAAVLDGDVTAERPSEREGVASLEHAIVEAADAVAQVCPSLAADLIACVVLAVVAALTSPWRVVALFVGLALPVAAALLASRRAVQRLADRAWVARVGVFDAFVEIFEGRLDLVASGHGDRAIREFGEKTSMWASTGFAVALSGMLAGRLPALLVTALAATVALAAVGGGPTLANVADVALVASIAPAFAGAGQGLHALLRIDPSVRSVASCLRGRASIATSLCHPPVFPGRVEFRSVSFSYGAAERDEPVLQGVCLDWAGPGALALAGANGSGKSTALRLLLKLVEPTSGSIRVGETPLAEMDPAAWRRRLGFLPQRPYFPARADIRGGIRWLEPEASDGTIVRVLERVGLADALRRRGEDPLGLRIDTLSVGQRQRVALARVLCRDVDLYVLDEPDANLDRAGVALLTNLVRDLARDRCVIFAAHSRELLEAADTVVRLGDGGLLRPGAGVRASSV